MVRVASEEEHRDIRGPQHDRHTDDLFDRTEVFSDLPHPSPLDPDPCDREQRVAKRFEVGDRDDAGDRLLIEAFDPRRDRWLADTQRGRERTRARPPVGAELREQSPIEIVENGYFSQPLTQPPPTSTSFLPSSRTMRTLVLKICGASGGPLPAV